MSENKKAKVVSNVVQYPSAKAGADARIKPLDGWQVQSPYGALKSHSGVDLVRLEDIHLWMYAKGMPPNTAVREIFSPFYLACLDAIDCGGTEALALPGELYALNAQTYPNGLFIEEKRSRNESVRFLAGAFPELGHVRFPDGSIGALVYSMAEGALRVWHGNADISTDHLAILQQRKERASDEKYSIKWPKDDDLRKLLGRLAVPIETAYELWGYGVLEASSEAIHKEPSTYVELVSARKLHAENPWTDAMVTLMAAEIDARSGQTGIRKGIAKQLDISAARIGQLLARETKRKPASVGNGASKEPVYGGRKS